MRPLRLILVCLLLGAVTTVGVAWGFARLTVFNGVYGVSFQTGPSSAWEFRKIRKAGTTLVSLAIISDAKSVSEATDYSLPRAAPEGIGRWVDLWLTQCEGRRDDSLAPIHLWARGWPIVALSNSVEVGTRTQHIYAGLAPFGLRNAGTQNVLPLRPLPLGFTVDTIFYGSIWFGLIMCPGFVRRRIRARRGLCPSCGYDMQGSSGTCPECGTPVVS